VLEDELEAVKVGGTVDLFPGEQGGLYDGGHGTLLLSELSSQQNDDTKERALPDI
jgi:hypothetical protein